MAIMVPYTSCDEVKHGVCMARRDAPRSVPHDLLETATRQLSRERALVDAGAFRFGLEPIKGLIGRFRAMLLRMVTLEMPNGAKAILEDGAWSSSTLGLANVLEHLMVDYNPSSPEGDPEYASACYIARKVKGRIIEHTPNSQARP